MLGVRYIEKTIIFKGVYMADYDDIKKNGSGCSDPTAYKAIQNIEKERARLQKLLDTIFTICEFAGYHVEERLVLKDKKTGKIWR